MLRLRLRALHQKAFGGHLHPDQLGSLQRFPDLQTGLMRRFPQGTGRGRNGKEGNEVDGRGGEMREGNE